MDEFVIHCIAGWLASNVTHDIGKKLILSFILADALALGIKAAEAQKTTAATLKTT